MDKKLINEDIQNMKYLFGYKPGRVISEQNIDYTTEDFSQDESELDEDMFAGWDELDNKERDMDTGEELYPSFSSDRKFMGMSKSMGDMNTDDEDTLFEQEEPENDRYMFFSNLEQIHRQMGILLEKDPEMIHSILENGHDWAQDHIATAKESIDQVFDFIMNEENGDGEEDSEMIMNEDLEFDEEETIESILEKHNLLDDAHLVRDNAVMFMNQPSEVIQRLLSILHLLTELSFLSIVDCESADFSDVDVCSLRELAWITLRGTENNLEEQGYKCIGEEFDGIYSLE